MVSVKVAYKSDEIDSIRITGHAHSQTPDQIMDMICAEVSAIVFGVLNSIDEQAKDSCEIEMDEIESGFISIQVLQSSPILQAILKTLEIQLKTIERVSKKYIQVKKTEV